MEPITRVAFVGRMMSGKTTARKLLEAENYLGLAFADRVKSDVVQMLNTLEQQYYGEVASYGSPFVLTRATIDEDKSVFRPLLQWLGTEYFRDYRQRPTHWIDMLTERIAIEAMMGVKRFVVDDARFENEIAALQALGFTIVRVAAPEAEWTQRMLAKYGSTGNVAEKMAHGSELLADTLPADLMVLNDGSVEALQAKLFSLLGLR